MSTEQQAALLEEQPWMPRPGENNLWYDRFARFLFAGASRSIRGVYNEEKGNRQSKPVPASWTQAARRFEWQRRAQAYDAHCRKGVFEHGNASDVERVRKLDDLAERMYKRLNKELALMPVNDKYLAQYLAVLDLLAKHTGGYAMPQRVSVKKEGNAIEVQGESGDGISMQVVFYMPEMAHLDSDTVVEAGPGSGGQREEQGEEAS